MGSIDRKAPGVTEQPAKTPQPLPNEMLKKKYPIVER